MNNAGTIHCPDERCRAPMVRRTNRGDGSAFMGCSRFPTCTQTREIPPSVLLREAGNAELPGLETEGLL